MFVRVATQLNCTENALWEKICKLESLQFIAAPILTFIPISPDALNSEWQVGRDYRFKLYLLKYIPLGLHAIELVTMDKNQHLIVSHESGQLASVWNHTISFNEITPNLVSYSDAVEIKAGWLSPVVYVFAHVFYRYRQRRLKILLQNKQQL